MSASRAFLCLLPVLLVAAPRAAWAADAGAAGDDEITSLEKRLAAEHDALATTDCSSACRALASIQRAVERICALDPGPRCADARSKADDATRRVREACPECAIAATTPAPPPKAAPAPRQEATLTAAPEKRGGCAGCATPGLTRGSSSPLDVLGLAALGMWLVRRSRRSRRGRS